MLDHTVEFGGGNPKKGKPMISYSRKTPINKWNNPFGALKLFLWVVIVGICLLFVIQEFGHYRVDENSLNLLLLIHYLSFLLGAMLASSKSRVLTEGSQVLVLIRKVWGTELVIFLLASLFILASSVHSLPEMSLRFLSYIAFASSSGFLVTLLSGSVWEKHSQLLLLVGAFVIIAGIAGSRALQKLPPATWFAPLSSAPHGFDRINLGGILGFWAVSIMFVLLSKYLLKRFYRVD